MGTKDLWKVIRMEPAQYKISVRNRQVSVLAVTDRTWVSPCRFRPDLKTSLTEEQTGTTTSRNGTNIQLRCLDADTGCFTLMGMFPVSTVTRNIRGCSSHVEANHGLAKVCGQRIAHYSSSWAGENCVAALKVVCRSEAPIGLHEEQVALLQSIRKTRAEAIEVLANVWGEIRSYHRRVTTCHHLNHRHHFVRERNLRKAKFSGQCSNLLLMLWERIGM